MEEKNYVIVSNDFRQFLITGIKPEFKIVYDINKAERFSFGDVKILFQSKFLTSSFGKLYGENWLICNINEVSEKKAEYIKTHKSNMKSLTPVPKDKVHLIDYENFIKQKRTIKFATENIKTATNYFHINSHPELANGRNPREFVLTNETKDRFIKVVSKRDDEFYNEKILRDCSVKIVSDIERATLFTQTGARFFIRHNLYYKICPGVWDIMRNPKSKQNKQ